MARDEIKLMIHSLNQTSRAALWSFLVARDRLPCFSFTKGAFWPRSTLVLHVYKFEYLLPCSPLSIFS